ncbi:MAG: TonB-dependent receptor [Acidobacteria bacterium]|nr:TonB-dependent receptor [Acidobacteriota bacterium]MCI0724598.1 TonB-dependent receptor [Acidobacteriota bacterium]
MNKLNLNLYRLTLLSLLTALCSGVAYAQMAQIAGRITDSTQAVVPDVAVTVTNVDTGIERKTTTNDDGYYQIPLLNPGNYQMHVHRDSFKPIRRDGIRLAVGQVARIDFVLEVGEVAQRIEVVAELSPVDISTGTLGTRVDTRRIEELPLNGRNVLSLAALTPGATRVFTNNGPAFLQQAVNVNGNRAHSTNIMLDGSSLNYPHRGASITQPPPEALQETRIVTNGVTAEYKRGSAAISTVTRSGTNELHGAVWHFLRNDALDARSFFATTVPKLRYNQFGAAAGGPIRRNKAFFFAAFQGYESPSERLVSSAFPPTEAERRGDFSNTRGTRPNDPITGQPFPNGIIPQDRIDPIAAKLLQRIPLPNRPNGQYVAQVGVPNSDRMFMGRLDYDIREGKRLTFRYFYDKPTSENPFPAGGNVDGYQRSILGNRAQNGTVSYVHTFTPAVLLNLRLGFTRFRYAETNTVKDTLASLGARFIRGRGGPDDDYLRLLFVTGRFNALSARAGVRTGETWDGSGDLSWLRGRHEIKLGADFQRLRNYFGPFIYEDVFFDGTYTGNPLADFMVSNASFLAQDEFLDTDKRSRSPGFFVQDRWRATSRLTLTLGLRWDIYTPWRKVNFPAGSFRAGVRSQSVPSAPVGLIYDSDPEYPDQMHWLNFGPRFGFAYDVFGDGKTSLRGGYGINHDPLIAQLSGASNVPPFLADVRTTRVGPISDLQRFIEVPYSKPIDVSNPTYTLPISLSNALDGDVVPLYVHSLNLTLEREVFANTMLQVSYVGGSAATKAPIARSTRRCSSRGSRRRPTSNSAAFITRCSGPFVDTTPTGTPATTRSS